jgi:hypothetical protein
MFWSTWFGLVMTAMDAQARLVTPLDVVEVTVARGLSDEAYGRAYALPEDYAWAAPHKLTPAGGADRRASIKNPLTAFSAAPRQLEAQVIRSTVSGFRLTWRDHASDEEGFLLERVLDPATFVVCATVEPDVNSFGWALEPPARKFPAHWAQKQPRDALEWAEKHLPPHLWLRGLSRAFGEWVDRNPAEAEAWLAGYLARVPANAGTDQLVALMNRARHPPNDD